jgi:hypothetical protein
MRWAAQQPEVSICAWGLLIPVHKQQQPLASPRIQPRNANGSYPLLYSGLTARTGLAFLANAFNVSADSSHYSSELTNGQLVQCRRTSH